MPESSGEKSQAATPHRRQQAREKGQVAQSQDLGSAALLIAGLVVLMMLGHRIADLMAGVARFHLGGDAWMTADTQTMAAQFQTLAFALAKVLLPVLGLLVAVSVLVNLMQVGLLFVPERVVPDISRIDPLNGLKRLFSLTSTMRLTFGLLKVLIIVVVAAVSLYGQANFVLGISQLEPAQIAVALTEILLWTALKIGAALLILALLDYAYQRWKHEQDLRMTNQEVREEMKNLQGDPQIIARRRSVQRQLVLNRLGDAVPRADVVITNPTELAIAVQYDPEQMAAPIVVAKGAGLVAQRIRRLAVQNAIPIVENKPLARSLYKEVELNHPIPDKMYAAVAEVLAYVYKLKGKQVPGAAAV